MPTRHRIDFEDYATPYGEYISYHGYPPIFGRTYDDFSFRDFLDFVTPGYHDKIKSGAIINTSAVYENVKRRGGGGGVSAVDVILDDGSTETYWFDGSSITGHFTNGYCPISYLGAADPAIERACKQRAIAQVDTTPNAFIEDIGELKSTFTLMDDPLRSAIDWSDSFRNKVNRRMHRGQSFRRASSGLWLTTRFGFMPLWRSLEALFSELSEPSPPQLLRKSSSSFNQSAEHDSYSDFGHEDYTLNISHRKVTKGHGTILYSITNPAADWRYRYGLRNKDIPRGLWDLVPLSFVVDRFLSVGDSISGLTNLSDPDVSFEAASYTSRTRHIQKMSLAGINDPRFHSLLSDTFEIERFLYDRGVWEPSFTDTLPYFHPLGLVDSVTKVIDGIALIVQNFSR